MTGHQFRAIRRFNRISQDDICMYSQFSHRSSIYRLEQETRVPEKFVQILSKLVGYDFTDQQVTNQYFFQLPTKYKEFSHRKVDGGMRATVTMRDYDGRVMSDDEW